MYLKVHVVVHVRSRMTRLAGHATHVVQIYATFVSSYLIIDLCGYTSAEALADYVGC
jgi:hypothetical protein